MRRVFSAPVVTLVLAAVMLFIISLINPQPPGILNVDPEQWATSGHFGLLSKVSTYLWLASALACGAAAYLLKDHAPEWATLFGWASALNWLYLLCDFFLLHEALQQIGVPRWLLYGVYSILAASLLVAFRTLFLQTNITMLASACIGLAAATVMKVGIPDEPYYIIEGVKLAGLACWSTYFCSLSIARLRDPNSKAMRLLSIRDAVIAAAIVGAIFLVFVGLRVSGFIESPYELVKEPTILLNMPLYVGLLSNVGILLIGSGGIAALLAGFAAQEERRGAERRFFLIVGAFLLWLSIDDYYLLHERALMFIGVPQVVTFSIYAIVALGILIVFRQMFLTDRGDLYLLVLGGLFLAGSIAIDLDLLWLREIADTVDYLEDALKLLGLLSWSLYLLRKSLMYLEHQMKQADSLPAAPQIMAPELEGTTAGLR